MAAWKRTLERVLSGGSDGAVRFAELQNLLKRLGFDERIKGDHHIYTRDRIEEILNVQPRNAMAKPYQVKQVRAVLTKYGLSIQANMDSGDSDGRGASND